MTTPIFITNGNEIPTTATCKQESRKPIGILIDEMRKTTEEIEEAAAVLGAKLFNETRIESPVLAVGCLSDAIAWETDKLSNILVKLEKFCDRL